MLRFYLWICRHPAAYAAITGICHMVPYPAAAVGVYVLGVAVPLWFWIGLTLGVLYNTAITRACAQIAVRARIVDRQDAARYAAMYDPELYPIGTHRNGTTHLAVRDDR